MIIPISRRSSSKNASSVFTLPSDEASNTVTLPRNVRRAAFSISACGQATEEFWWGNVPDEHVGTFDATTGPLYGHANFRQVEILLDGRVIGIHWPFPVIFTGGVAPGLWRPIVGIDAYDLREHEIDITYVTLASTLNTLDHVYRPLLGQLCDGLPHTFEIRVTGVAGDLDETLAPSIGHSWHVTGKIFLWLDPDPESVTTSTQLTVYAPNTKVEISSEVTQNATGFNETFYYATKATRALVIFAQIVSQSGARNVSWTQSLEFSNVAHFTDFGRTQYTRLESEASDEAQDGERVYSKRQSSPLECTQTIVVEHDGNITIDATIDRSLKLDTHGESVFPQGLSSFETPDHGKTAFEGSVLDTRQNGSSWYFASPRNKIARGSGSTRQHFAFSGKAPGVAAEQLYCRDAVARDGIVTLDQEWLYGKQIGNISKVVETALADRDDFDSPFRTGRQLV